MNPLNKRPTTERQAPLYTFSVTPILFALVVAVLPHLGRLPPWIVLWCAVFWGYQSLYVRLKWPAPPRFFRTILTVSGLIGLLLTYSTRLGSDAYLGLLAIMSALKPFEITSHRDRMVTVFLAYFIVITSLFQSETLAMTLYMLISVGVTTSVLIRVNDPKSGFKDSLKQASIIMAQAIPLMVALFFLFPRIQGGFFGFTRSGKGISGFSDAMRPGAVSMLAENDAIAFRAQFKGPIPQAHLLYWRGIVFEAFDGREWRAAKTILETGARLEGENPAAYTVTLEPHEDRYLFVLEMPAEYPKTERLLDDFTLRSHRPVFAARRYAVTSYTTYRTGPETPVRLERTVGLPEDGNPKARQLALELTREAAGPDEKVARVLDYFAKGGFVYTLEPPLLGRDQVDDFLFMSKEGYCEHYASAFAFMMRAAGVPARIVGGYQGGEVNPFGGYLIVRQKDAHVWVEIWDGKNGWRRVDPTAAVAPGRITGGIEGALAPGELPAGIVERYFGNVADIVKQVRFWWDSISTAWSAWFSAYSFEEQRALLERLGINAGTWDAALKALGLLLVLTLVIAGGVGFWMLRPPKERPDRVGKYYALFAKKLAKAGLEREPGMGPSDYAALVAKIRPDLAKQAGDIIGLYIRLRYGNGGGEGEKEAFGRKVKAFRAVGRDHEKHERRKMSEK